MFFDQVLILLPGSSALGLVPQPLAPSARESVFPNTLLSPILSRPGHCFPSPLPACRRSPCCPGWGPAAAGSSQQCGGISSSAPGSLSHWPQPCILGRLTSHSRAVSSPSLPMSPSILYSLELLTIPLKEQASRGKPHTRTLSTRKDLGVPTLLAS